MGFLVLRVCNFPLYNEEVVNLPTFVNINSILATQANVSLWMVCTSNVHSLASGNKFYKLHLNFEYARQQGFKQLLSFGGAYSNHIHALALMANAQGFESIGIIRGEPEYANNPTLTDVQWAGMQLEFVSRQQYRLRDDPDFVLSLKKRYPDALILPEGGSNELAVKGCQLLMQQINEYCPQQIDIVSVACGTGGTFAGLVSGLEMQQQALGFSVLRDESLTSRVKGYLNKVQSSQQFYQIEQADYGGYAKLSVELLDFIRDWLDQTGILLDPIYTSKMCKRLLEMIEQGDIKPQSTVAVIHSGGLQAWRGMKERVIRLKGEHFWQSIEAHL